ncbi:MAG: nitrogenase iron protein NifH [Eubacteriales bacterium]|nr:nitrogenase iron protein NifH [Eubacteriales bacterium]
MPVNLTHENVRDSVLGEAEKGNFKVKKICIYGKGGIGKSTTVSNVAAALAQEGYRTAVVGCDPKADSTRNLTGRRVPTVLDCLKGGAPEIAQKGFADVLCIESGGPEPGTGCAGRGIIAAMQEIRERNLLDGLDVILYDVLGDVVCGGFSMPLREGIADEVYLVTTCDYMALYAANNICKGLLKYANTSQIRLGGILYNERSSRQDAEVVERFAERIGTRVIGRIPMDSRIGEAEIKRKTVIELFPEAEISGEFRKLAHAMLTNPHRCIPTPLEEEELEALWNVSR